MTRHALARTAFAIGIGSLLSACSANSTMPAAPSGNASLAAAASSKAEDSKGTPTVRVRCEARALPARSKASVDGRDLAAGQYTARIQSGANSVNAAAKPAVGDEAEFDFDSDGANIAAGATAISANFIQGGAVTGSVLNSAGAIVATATVSCQVQ